MKEIDLIKKVRNRTLEALIRSTESVPGADLKDVKVSIVEVRKILYKECLSIAKEIFEEEF